MAELSHSARVRYHFSSKQEEAVLRKLHLESSFRAEGRVEGEETASSGALLVIQGMRRAMSISTWNYSKCSLTAHMAGGSRWLLHNAGVSLSASPGSVKGIARVLILGLDAREIGLLREEAFSVFSSSFHVLSPFRHVLSTRWRRSLGEAAVLPGVRGLRDAAWQNALPELAENGCTSPLVHTVSFWSFLTTLFFFFLFPCRFVEFRGIFFGMEVKTRWYWARILVYFIWSQNCVAFEHGKEWPIAIIISRKEGNNFCRIFQIHRKPRTVISTSL